MCGIAGIITKAPLERDLQKSVREMNKNLFHRGPNGSGEFSDQHISMAMRRLSIIDLKKGGQPLYNENGDLALVANGEIYNFIELREQLKNRGHRFSTGSDCETILHLYEEFGLDFVDHLRGMFALALWDSKKQKLVLARDRMGEKPLYFYKKEDMLIFASELKSLLSSELIPFEFDPESINNYFHYAWVPEPQTPIKGVKKLDAAHLLEVDVDPWNIQEERCYWRMEDAPEINGNPSEIIRAELEEISKLVVRSDVPVGVALSGGLDSSAIAALAAKQYPGTMHAFSVGYPGHPPFDERKDAKALADNLGIPFHDIELRTADMVDEFPEMVFKRDDPIADISGYGYYSVMKHAHEHGVPVVLQGQGGDELFWGYSWVREALKRSKRSDKLARLGWKLFPNLFWERIPDSIHPKSLYSWLKNGAGLPSIWSEYKSALNRSADEVCFYEMSSDFKDAESKVGSYYSELFKNYTKDVSPKDIFRKDNSIKMDIFFTKLICDTYLRENGIAQGDRLSMASSVELRLPLLDHKLIETVIGLRKSNPDNELPPKAWLRSAVEKILPEEVINRPKRGFSPPSHEWMKKLFKRYGNHLNGGLLVEKNVLSEKGGRRLAEGNLERGVVHPLSFKALVLEEWTRKMSEIS